MYMAKNCLRKLIEKLNHNLQLNLFYVYENLDNFTKVSQY